MLWEDLQGSARLGALILLKVFLDEVKIKTS